MSQDYVVLESLVADGDIPVTLYENKITGMRVVTGYVECPIVKGDLVFATEAFDDDGLPHTLEHLVYLGSENYPYKGVLDMLANKCLADGTNAYTDTDHTSYQLVTAGNDGFLNLLPIYLEHLLFPTLTDSAFTTEVHHINEEGENAGVVYCEMQGRENSGESICSREMLNLIYPGVCGYRSETGGILENLRSSTTNVKVREYHKKFYHSKNLCIIVIGPVEGEAIFKAIKPIEDMIVERGLHKIDFQRPWQTPVEPLAASSHKKIQFPSDTDDDGLVYIGFRGPNVVTDFKEFSALSLVLDYLNTTAISPIQREFVECDEPYCSSISHSFIENSTSCFYLTFESVGKEYLDLVNGKLQDLLKNIVEKKEKFDMERMQNILSRNIVRILSAAETSPHAIVVGPVIGHFLYGLDKMKERFSEIANMEEFKNNNEDFWLELINKYMVRPESRHVCIVGEPSPSTMRSMAEAEKLRILEQKERLGPKLPDLAEELRKSIENNERPAPATMLSCVSVPSPDNIKFHPIERFVLDASKLPFRFQYDSIKTNFVTIQILMNTSNVLSKSQRLYLPLLSEILLECPIRRDGILIPYEKVVAELYKDTVTYGTSIGISSSAFHCIGAMSMVFSLMMQVENTKYDKAVNWCNELLFKTVFTAERIKTVATKIVSDISQYKRSGGKVVSAAMNAMTYQSNSNQWAANFMRQQKFLKQLIDDLKTDPTTVEKNLTEVLNIICRPDNLLVHLTVNKNKIALDSIHEPWKKFIPEDTLNSCPKEQIKLDGIIQCHELVDLVKEPKGAIVGVGSVESGYLQQLVKSINSLKHPDLAAVNVLIQYLTQLEGPLWRQIRGLGLSYSYSIQLSPTTGLMYFVLSKSSQLVAAYLTAKKLICQYLDGELDYEDNLFESAKSVLVFEHIRREKSAAGKSMQSLIGYLRDLDINHNTELIKKVMAVTKEDLRRVGPIYLRPLFEDEQKRIVVCCHPSKIDDISEGLKSATGDLVKINLEQTPFLSSTE